MAAPVPGDPGRLFPVWAELAEPEPDLRDRDWYTGFLFSQALTVGGGTGEVQRNIVAERVLGLPHDVDVEAGRSWAEARTAVPR
jgi:hypothetical protein